MKCLAAWHQHEPVCEQGTFIKSLLRQPGVFETMACINGVIPLWNEHWFRISHAAASMSLMLPSEDQFLALLKTIIQRFPHHVIKLLSTASSWAVMVHDFPDYEPRYWEEGITAITCKTRLNAPNKHPCTKQIQRTIYQQATLEFATLQVQEGLMLDNHGAVIEGTKTNVFAVKHGSLWTPALKQQGVAGVARRYVIAYARKMGMDIRIETLQRASLNTADELFLTNALVGIWPIKILDGQTFVRGPVTQRLMKHIGMMHGCYQTLV